MEWNNDDIQKLIEFKDAIDSDDIRIKEKIKQILITNKYIMKILNNTELEDIDADESDYLDTCILPYYIIQPTQSNIKNFICYEVSYDELNSFTVPQKRLQIIFYVMCEQANIKEKYTGIARHDLLASLIEDQFNFTNYFGKKIKLISDVPTIVDNDYACRTLVFQQLTDNNVVKSSGNKYPRLANKIGGGNIATV